MIRGGGDFLLKLVARDTAHENQLTQRLTGVADGQPGADAADDPHQPQPGGRAAVAPRWRVAFVRQRDRDRRSSVQVRRRGVGFIMEL